MPNSCRRGRYPALDALSAHCEARPEFTATYPAAWSGAMREPIGVNSRRVGRLFETGRG